MTRHGTAIEWTHRRGTRGQTWNPIRARNKATGGVGHFCVHASAACAYCYAERLQPRFQNPIRFAAQDRDQVEIYLDEKTLAAPLHWTKPRTIFVCSMSDLFGEWILWEMIDQVFAVAARTPQHVYIILTKRAQRMRQYFEIESTPARVAEWMIRAQWPDCQMFKRWPLPNVWLGVSAEDQATADARIPELLAAPAAMHFVSYEPALGPVEFTPWLPELGWLIAGGESGPNARPPHPDWFRAARDQCAAAGVPFFFKQWGEWMPHVAAAARFAGGDETIVGSYDGRHVFQSGGSVPAPAAGHANEPLMIRVGKKKAGAALDGREHRAFPEAA